MNTCGPILLIGTIALIFSAFAFAVSPWLGWLVLLGCMTCLLLVLRNRHDDTGGSTAANSEAETAHARGSFQALATEQSCRDCGEIKPSSDFILSDASMTGLGESCNECSEIYHWAEEFNEKVYQYGLDREFCSLCDGELVLMGRESDCYVFKICSEQHASYSRMVCYRLGFEREERFIPRGTHFATCKIALAFTDTVQKTNILEDLPDDCWGQQYKPERVHYLSKDGGIWCRYKYVNMDAECRTANANQVTCKRCLRRM